MVAKSNTAVGTTRVALYCRVSSQEQAEHGQSLDDQQERLQAWAKGEGWQVAGVYIDEGRSGGDDDRLQLQNLMLDARNGRFDLLIVTKVDRFFRNNRLMLNYLYTLKNCNVAFASKSEGIDTRSPIMGNIFLNMLGSMAEYERERIGQRVADFRQHRASKGQWSSGRTLFGYRFNKTTKQLDINESEAQAVRFIFNEYVNKNIGTVRLAERMNREGYMPPRSNRGDHQLSNFWTPTTVAHILHHPAYMGGPNNHWQFQTPAIIDSLLWQKAQLQLSANYHFRENSTKSPYQGLFRCGLCGHTLRRAFNHNVLRVWECPGRLKRLHLDGSDRCTLPRTDAEMLEGVVIGKVMLLWKNPKMLAQYVDETIRNLEHEISELKRRVSPVQNNIAGMVSKIERLGVMFQLGTLSTDEYKAKVTSLRAGILSAERQLDEADPLLLRQIDDNQKALRYWESYIEAQAMISSLGGSGDDEVDELVNKAFEGIITPVVDERIYDQPDLVTAEQLRKLGWAGFVYPDRVELKGLVSVGKTNTSPTSRLMTCPTTTADLTIFFM